MVLRSLFWIAVVALLMPHEPDLGLENHDLPQSVAAPKIQVQIRDVNGVGPIPSLRIEVQPVWLAYPVRAFRAFVYWRLGEVRKELEAPKTPAAAQKYQARLKPDYRPGMARARIASTSKWTPEPP